MSGFDVDFEVEILAGSSRDFAYRKVVRRIVADEDCWSTDAHRTLWGLIVRLGDGDALTGAIVARAADDLGDDEAEEVIAAAKRVLTAIPKAKHYAASELSEWVRATRMKIGMSEAIKLLGDGKVDDAEDALRRASRTPSLCAYDAEDWWAGFDARQEERVRAKREPDLRPVIATRLPTLDRILTGGLRGSQVGLIVGHTGKGKSATATHFAFYSAAASNPTAYISTEMNLGLVNTRFDAKFFSKPASDFTLARFTKAELEAFADKRRRLKVRLEKMLRTVSVPVRTLTKAMIEEILDEYEQEVDQRVRTLIVDSPDHMRPPAGVREYRLQQASAYWDVKQIAEERELAAWATCQAPKDYIAKLITAEGTADSYDKARISDVMVTLNQTPAEKKLDLLRLFVAKNRGGEMGELIYLASDFARMHIEETTPPSASGGGS